jgi:hypothetical protein
VDGRPGKILIWKTLAVHAECGQWDHLISWTLGWRKQLHQSALAGQGAVPRVDRYPFDEQRRDEAGTNGYQIVAWSDGFRERFGSSDELTTSEPPSTDAGIAGFGLLIQTAVGSGAGVGTPCGKRSGCARCAAASTTAR